MKNHVKAIGIQSIFKNTNFYQPKEKHAQLEPDGKKFNFDFNLTFWLWDFNSEYQS